MEELETLDLLDDEDKIVSLESSILDIETATRYIHDNDGVSRDVIAPFIHLMPPSAPLTSFSEMPSYSNYGVSLEALGAALGAFVAGLAVAIAVVLAKLVTWLVTLFKGGSKAGDIAVVSSHNIKAIGTADRQVVAKMTMEQRRAYDNLADENTRAVQDTLSGTWNGLTEAVLSRTGPILVLERLYPLMTGTLQRAEEKLDLFLEIGHRSPPKDPAKQHALLSELTTLTIPGNLEVVRKEIGGVVDAKNAGGFLELARAFSDKLKSMKDGKASGKLNLNKLGEDIENGRVEALDMDDPNNRTAAKLNSLQSLIAKLNGFKAPDGVGDEVLTAMKNAIASIKDELLAAQHYFQQFADVMRVQGQLIAAVRTLYQRNHNGLSKLVVEGDNESAKDALRDANKELNKSLKK